MAEVNGIWTPSLGHSFIDWVLNDIWHSLPSNCVQNIFLENFAFLLHFEFHPKLNQKQFILLNESSKQKHFDCSYSIKLYIILSRTLCMDEIMQQQLSILLSNVVIQTEFYERYIFFLFSLRFDVAKVIIQWLFFWFEMLIIWS